MAPAPAVSALGCEIANILRSAQLAWTEPTLRSTIQINTSSAEFYIIMMHHSPWQHRLNCRLHHQNRLKGTTLA